MITMQWGKNLLKKIIKIVNCHKTIAFVFVMIMTSVIVFRDFIFGNYLFLYTDANDDTFQSFLPVYQMVVNRISNKNFDLMGFSSGLGENILSMQLAVLDPFAIVNYIVGLLWGSDKIAYALVYTQICRIVAAGLACKYALSFSEISISSQYFCSLLYAFSAYTVGDIGQHYFFATALVFIAIGYGLVMKCKENSKYTLFLSIYVAVVCIWSVYFAFMILGACACLFLYHVIIYPKMDKCYTISVVLAVVVGLMLSAIIFIPSANLILGMTDRVNNGVSLTDKFRDMFRLFGIKEYRDIILRMFSNQLGGSITNWNGIDTPFNTEHLFYSCIFPIGFIYYLYNLIKTKSSRKKLVTIVYVIIILICVMTPIVGTIMNAFSEYSARYWFVLMPFMAYVVGKLLDSFKDKWEDKKYISLAAIGITISCIYFISSNFNYASLAARKSMISVVVCLIIFLSVILISDKMGKKISIALGVVMVIYNVVDGSVSLKVERNIVCKDWYRTYGINTSVMNAVNDTEASGTDFWRLERSFLDYGIQTATMYSNVANYRGVSFYNSLASPGLNEFRHKLLGVESYSQTRATYAFGDFGLPFDSVIADFMGIKYIVSDYMVDDNDWQYIEEVSGRYLYKNIDLEYAGLLYDTYICQDRVEDLSELEREKIIGKAVILEDEPYGICSYTSNNMDDVECTLIDKAQVVNSNERFEIPVEIEMKGQSWLKLECCGSEAGNIQFLYDTTFGYYQGFWENQFSNYEEGAQTIIVRVPNDIKSVCIIPSSEITIQSLKIVNNSKVNYSNDGVELYNNNLAGNIKGTVTTSNPQILVLPINFDENWSAQMDGVDIKLIKADYSFIGMYIPEGKHYITMEYNCPGYKEGIIISIIGLIFFGINVMFMCRKSMGMSDKGKIKN